MTACRQVLLPVHQAGRFDALVYWYEAPCGGGSVSSSPFQDLEQAGHMHQVSPPSATSSAQHTRAHAFTSCAAARYTSAAKVKDLMGGRSRFISRSPWHCTRVTQSKSLSTARAVSTASHSRWDLSPSSKPKPSPSPDCNLNLHADPRVTGTRSRWCSRAPWARSQP